MPSTQVERREAERGALATEQEPERRMLMAWLGRLRTERRGFPRALFWLATGLELLPGAWAMAAIGTYLYIALSRFSFPFDLEWMEGSVVDHVAQILERGHVYGEPSLEFTPYIYNPVYYYVSAAVALVTGVDYTALRSVSIAASLVSLGTIFALIRRETSSSLCGVISAGLFASTYKLSNAWFDVARVDSLAVAFCLLTMYLVRFGEKSRTIVLAGVLGALMLGTKQSLGPILPICFIYLLVFESWRKALWFAVPAFGVSAVSMLVLNVVSGGWYLKYTFWYPRSHDLGFITPKEWQIETAGVLIFTLAFALFFLLGGADLKKKAFYGVLGVALILVAYYSRAHSLSHVNVNIPAHVALALLAGLGLRPFLERGSLSGVLASAALLLQFEILRYKPKEFIPSHVDRIAAQKLAGIIRDIDGEVYLPHHGFIAAREGKGNFAHDIAVYDVERAKIVDRKVRGKVRAEVARAVKSRRFAAIILDYDSQGNLPGLDANYRRATLDLGDPAALATRTGMRTRPSMIYFPRGAPRHRR